MILCLFSSNSFCQTTELNYENKPKHVSIDVIKTYERIVSKGYKSVDLYEKLGNSYYDNSEMEKAVKWYRKLFAITYELESKYYYQYYESLRFIGKNDEANAVLEKLNEKSKNQNK